MDDISQNDIEQLKYQMANHQHINIDNTKKLNSDSISGLSLDLNDVTGTLGETHGGTGQSTYTLGDTLYADAANSLAKLAGNVTTTKKFLNQTGTGAVSAAPVWSALDTGDITSGTLSVVRGGTGAAILAAHGVVVGNGTNSVSVTGAGTTGQVLASNGPSADPTFQSVSSLISVAPQYIRFLIPSSSAIVGPSSLNVAAGTDSTGDNLYVAVYLDLATDNILIYRYTKDANTGMYSYNGNSATLVKATDFTNDNNVGITAGSTYVWFVQRTSGDIKIIRFDKDFGNKTTMTISGSWAFTLNQIGYAAINSSDSTLIVSANAASGFQIYTISGTTATTNGSAVTRTSSLSTVAGAFFDGTTFYQLNYGARNDIKAYNTSGTLQSTTPAFLFDTNTTITATGSPVGIGYGGTGKIYIFSVYANAVSNYYELGAYLVTKP